MVGKPVQHGTPSAEARRSHRRWGRPTPPDLTLRHRRRPAGGSRMRRRVLRSRVAVLGAGRGLLGTGGPAEDTRPAGRLARATGSRRRAACDRDRRQQEPHREPTHLGGVPPARWPRETSESSVREMRRRPTSSSARRTSSAAEADLWQPWDPRFRFEGFGQRDPRRSRWMPASRPVNSTRHVRSPDAAVNERAHAPRT